MAINQQLVGDRFAIYNGDCIEVMKQLPSKSIHLSVYSPPFGGIYCYSSDLRDLSNNDNYEQFLEHYAFVVKEIARITLPGRMTAVHCMDFPMTNSGADNLVDFSGDVIRMHKNEGFRYIARYCVWKEPLGVRNRTMKKSLHHKTIVEDSSKCSNASADYILIFRSAGENKIPITHPVGLLDYAGERRPPVDILRYRGMVGNQIENQYSHWIWRQYASSFWDDVRIDRVLPFKLTKEENDEKHLHPLQLDVIERCIVLWSNPGENILTPFMGVGSEVYSSVMLGRRGIGIELKSSYYQQAVLNIKSALNSNKNEVIELQLEDEIISD